VGNPRHSREGGNPEASTTEAQRHRELPEGWVEASLFDVCSPKQWPTISTMQLTESGYPVYGANGKIGFYSAYNHDEETILITCRGATCGVLNICEPKSYVNGNAMALNGLNQSYIMLDYLLSTLLNRGMKDAISGTAQPQITKTGLEVVSIPLAPLNEQKRIVAKVEALQARSRKAREALAEVPKLVGQFKQSVLAAAFRGDLTKTWREQHPDTEPAEQLLERIRTERRQQWETNQLATFKAKNKTPPKNWQSKYKEPAPVDTTDLPELPAGWCWASMNELLLGIDAGKSFTCHERPPLAGEKGIVKISAVTWGEFNQSESKTVFDTSRLNSRHRIQSGDFLMSRANTIELVGAPVIVEEINLDLFLSDKVLRLKFVADVDRWVLQLLRTKLGRKQIESKSTGNQLSMRNIGQNSIREIAMPFAPLEEQHQITYRIESLFAYADSILEQAKASLGELDRLDQSILAKAFRGELVPQDPNDEPASVLLEHINAERAAATPVKRSRKSKPQEYRNA